MGVLSKLFGSNESKPKLLTPPWMLENMRSVSEAAKPSALSYLRSAGQPYPGQLSAPMSPLSQTGLGRLSDILSKGPVTENPLFKSAAEELQTTMTGGYDPFESEYYQGVRSGLMRELAEAKNRLAATSSARDRYASSGRNVGEARLEEGAMSTLAQVLGRLAEAERGRRLAAAGAVPGLLGFGQQAELTPVQAALTLGDFGRQLEQAELDRQLAEYQRQRGEMTNAVNALLGASTFQPEWYVPSYGLFGTPAGTRMMGNLMGGLGSVLGGLGSAIGGALSPLAGLFI